MDTEAFAINIEARLKDVATPWSPIDLGICNDHVVRLAKFRGAYHWHSHPNGDELFFVYRGEITIQMHGGKDMVLKTGEIGVVPKGVGHCPKSDEDAYVLMLEPLTLKNVRELEPSSVQNTWCSLPMRRNSFAGIRISHGRSTGKSVMGAIHSMMSPARSCTWRNTSIARLLMHWRIHSSEPDADTSTAQSKISNPPTK
jgi:mannose-6-phosphate isomerase-like protein (cupin superfamily)